MPEPAVDGHPGEERFIEVNADDETWVYTGSTIPTEEASAYYGDASRITSYNVCYTKLLRERRERTCLPSWHPQDSHDQVPQVSDRQYL